MTVHARNILEGMRKLETVYLELLEEDGAGRNESVEAALKAH